MVSFRGIWKMRKMLGMEVRVYSTQNRRFNGKVGRFEI